MIERWLAAIRDHPGRPSTAQRMALQSLALRLDWRTGTGYASVRQVAEDSDVSEPTVRRATSWARGAEYLLQLRRGHRLGNGQTAATEWKLTQPLTGDLLTSQPLNGAISTAHHADLNRSPQNPLQETSSSEPSSSLPARASALLRAAGIEATERETGMYIQKVKNSGGRNVLAIIRKNIADGDAAALIADARQQSGNGSRHPASGLAGRFADITQLQAAIAHPCDHGTPGGSAANCAFCRAAKAGTP